MTAEKSEIFDEKLENLLSRISQVNKWLEDHKFGDLIKRVDANTFEINLMLKNMIFCSLNDRHEYNLLQDNFFIHLNNLSKLVANRFTVPKEQEK